MYASTYSIHTSIKTGVREVNPRFTSFAFFWVNGPLHLFDGQRLNSSMFLFDITQEFPIRRLAV